ncbi:hypothetical protein CKAH01_06434 [Colletotrichum kahawae]|uniref:Uncharacterized protein n=1 Tax=Colletotrichum kahawae TaxID=34407 RepID=A0AAE0D2U9_COLKA|nr:hypothetical protein CKAH01_06434 [Colletotrichum kahawae]
MCIYKYAYIICSKCGKDIARVTGSDEKPCDLVRVSNPDCPDQTQIHYHTFLKFCSECDPGCSCFSEEEVDNKLVENAVAYIRQIECGCVKRSKPYII